MKVLPVASWRHQVGAGHVFGGDLLVLADDGVGAGGIDDVDIVDADRCHVRRGRRHAFFHQALAGERIDERALSGVELPDDDKQEELVELLDRSLQRRHGLVGGAEADEARAQVVQDAPLLAHDLLLSRIEQSLQRHSPRTVHYAGQGRPLRSYESRISRSSCFRLRRRPASA